MMHTTAFDATSLDSPPCDCPAAGYCPRHRRPTTPFLHQKCRTDPAFRRLRDSLVNTLDVSSNVTSPASLDLSCRYRGEPLRSVVCELCGPDRGQTVEVHRCAVHGECTLKKWKSGTARAATGAPLGVCLTCDDRQSAATSTATKVILRSDLSPGDVLTLTAAVESLHATYPGRYQTDVRTCCPSIWEHNPHITPLRDDEAPTLKLDYPTIHQSNQRPTTFLEGYTLDLGARLGVSLQLTTNRPHLYLTEDEKHWLAQPRELAGGRELSYWVLNAGVKRDFTAKQWPLEHYQEVVDRTRGRIQWVQIGAREHDHEALHGVIDLRGKTDLRQLIRLVYHAEGGLGPVTLLQHLCAAWERPYVCLVGGREPTTWVTYPQQHTLHTLGAFSCCARGACWKSRVTQLGDGDSKDQSLCERPVLGLRKPVAACMSAIQPTEVAHVIERVSAGRMRR